MRRKEKEISDAAAIEAILSAAQVVRLGLADGDLPYVVPVSFAWTPGRLYVHSALSGRKLDILKKNSLVCFELEGRTELVAGASACDWGMHFESVIGYGRAVIVEDEAGRIEGLNAIMRKYAGRDFRAGGYDPAALKRTALIRIEIESMTGKKS
jgi:nitroimidazol reductase NimA-like FMN-containing flavoprotein (pyridoxamine 5'-phosphate oxidase superfamily)